MFNPFHLRGRLALAVLSLALPLAALSASAEELDSGLTRRAACERPDAAASTVYAAPAEPPTIATLMRLSGTALVEVEIDANGNVTKTSIAKSSGTRLLDRSALRAAQESKFKPEIRDCEPVGGQYIFVVDFQE